MRTKKKKMLYIMFLLITVLMFLHGWKTYVTPPEQSANYVKKHHQIDKPLHHFKKSYHYYKNTVLHS
ncbi:MAG: hypothetical protein COB66_02915 [Coxiella sp. (in: Bacteria)]|nr:MAG: hypothetical protein COB66_02915 [Coxiella sp. (in: g-proteobacteria)]